MNKINLIFAKTTLKGFGRTRRIADIIRPLEHLGRDDCFGLQINDWVEVLDDYIILRNQANFLLQVIELLIGKISR